jgi:hypothetical protein
MATLFKPERLKKIKEVVADSVTPIQFETRKSIKERLEKYILESTSDEDFYAKAWNDFPVWTLSFIDDDSGNPLFLARWQIEYAQKLAHKRYVWAMCSRKVGKSTLLAIKNIHDMCGLKPKRISCFAPTMKQDYVFDKMNRYLATSPYLYEVFVDAGSLTKEYIELTNHSSSQNRTIGIATKGELVRGEYGDIVTVDENQKIEQSVMRQIIEPILADSYSEKSMRLLGTPNLYTNPSLDSEWRKWVRDSEAPDSEYGYMRVDWQRGVLEGCLNEKYILKMKEKMTPDEFAMEFEAIFPEQGTRFFDVSMLSLCMDNSLSFTKEPEAGKTYVMAVDYAKFVNRTQIVIGEWNPETKKMKYAFWREIDPKREKLDYETQIDIVKELFWKYKCVWICPDATSNQDALISMLTTRENAIPPALLYHTGERVGYCASDVLNDSMWRNHRQQITRGRIIVPTAGATEKRFADKWKKEHNELDVKIIRNGQMIKLEEPMNGYKDLAVACGMLSLYIPLTEKTKPSMGIFGW